MQLGTAIFIEEETYQANERESKSACREIALANIRKRVLEKIGIYVASASEDYMDNDFQIVTQEIIVLTAGIIQTERLEETFDGSSYHVKVKVGVDPEQVRKAVDEFAKEWRTKDKALKRLRSPGMAYPPVFSFAGAAQRYDDFLKNESTQESKARRNQNDSAEGLNGTWLLVGRADNGKDGIYDPIRTNPKEALVIQITPNPFMPNSDGLSVEIRRTGDVVLQGDWPCEVDTPAVAGKVPLTIGSGPAGEDQLSFLVQRSGISAYAGSRSMKDDYACLLLEPDKLLCRINRSLSVTQWCNTVRVTDYRAFIKSPRESAKVGSRR
jgi:hypothetical protein